MNSQDEQVLGMADTDRNPAMSFTARDARKATDEAGGDMRRVARRMAEAYCERTVMPRIRKVAETGVESTANVIEPLSSFMRCVWGSAPTEGWLEFDADRQEWGMTVSDEQRVGDEFSSSHNQPWNRQDSPYRQAMSELERMLAYRQAMSELERMLEEAGYAAHACMEIRGEPVYAGGRSTYWAVRVTASW